MNLKEIQEMPTVIENIHESCFRSYQILYHILTMVERGDSKQTIMEMHQLLNSTKK